MSSHRARFAAALVLSLVVCSCRGGDLATTAGAASSENAATAAPATRQSASPDPQVAAAVDQVLSSSTLPGFRWEKVSDVAPVLKPVYER